MAITFDAVSLSGIPLVDATSVTWIHTPSGTPTFLTVAFHDQRDDVQANSITYGGINLTQHVAITHLNNSPTSEIWYLDNPPAGAQTVVINFSGPAGTRGQRGGAITYTGGGAPGPTATQQGTGLAATIDVSSDSNALVVDAMSNTTNTLSEGAGQTRHYGGGLVHGGSTEPGAATVTMSWTIGGATDRDFTLAGMSVTEAPGPRPPGAMGGTS